MKRIKQIIIHYSQTNENEQSIDYHIIHWKTLNVEEIWMGFNTLRFCAREMDLTLCESSAYQNVGVKTRKANRGGQYIRASKSENVW